MAFEYTEPNRIRFLPAALEDRLIGFVAQAVGACLLALVAVCWISLLSWSIRDPSLSHVTGGTPTNLLGAPGAIVSDLLLQSFGFAVVALLLAPMIWGVELVSKRACEGLGQRLSFWPVAAVGVCGAASSLPVFGGWPLNSGFGGIVGDGVFGGIEAVAIWVVPQFADLATGFGLAALGASALSRAVGLGIRAVAGDGAEDAYCADAGLVDRPAAQYDEVAWDDDDESEATDRASYCREDGYGGGEDTRIEPAFDAPWSSHSGPNARARPEPPRARRETDEAIRHSAVEHPRPHADDDHLRHMAGGGDRAGSLEPQYPDPDNCQPNWHPAGFKTGPEPDPEPEPPTYEAVAEEAKRRSGAYIITDQQAFDRHTDEACFEMARRFAPVAAQAGADQRDWRVAEPNDPEISTGPPSADADLPAFLTGRARGAAVAAVSASTADPSGFGPAMGHSQVALPNMEAVDPTYVDSHGPPGPPVQPPHVGARVVSRGPAPTGAANAAGRAAGTTLMSGMTFHRGGPPAYRRPSLKLLKAKSGARPGPEFSQRVLRGNARLLEDVLGDFGIKGEVKDIRPGPVVTLFELEPARGVKASRVIGLADDIARSMSATAVRIGVVPGRNVIGIELPNSSRETVLLREILEADTFRKADGILPIALGKSIGGEPVVSDLARMPHLLVAGTTGSGKSVGVNAMVLSLLYRHGPEQCRFLMIDPKMLELSVYNDIPHLLCPVVVDPHKAVRALNWIVGEMEERYKRMSKLSVRSIDVFNNRVRNAKKRGEMIARTVQTGFDRKTHRAIYEHEQIDAEPMPYIVVVIDEFADLMATAGKEVEAAVQRLAQMARAAGIHIIMATQRPSVDVITGTIKANLPTRVSFKVASRIDSRTILNEHGAEQLLGQGDMLYAAGSGQSARLHGPFVADEEVEMIAQALREQGGTDYVQQLVDHLDGVGDSEPHSVSEQDGEVLYDRAVGIVVKDRKASVSYLQRRLAVGYNRAADLIERMETDEIISPASPSGRREVLGARKGEDG